MSVDGSASSDPDGTITAFAWDWGDGATSGGALATHNYATGGSYTITLTVTDNRGGTASTTRQVTLVLTLLAQDNFTRTTVGSFGTAVVGGTWSGTGTGLGTNGTTGNMTISAGQNLQTTLPDVASSNLDLAVKSSPQPTRPRVCRPLAASDSVGT